MINYRLVYFYIFYDKKITFFLDYLDNRHSAFVFTLITRIICRWCVAVLLGKYKYKQASVTVTNII